MLAQGYLLQPGEDGQELFRQAIDRLWAEGDAGEPLAGGPRVGGPNVSARQSLEQSRAPDRSGAEPARRLPAFAHG